MHLINRERLTISTVKKIRNRSLNGTLRSEIYNERRQQKLQIQLVMFCSSFKGIINKLNLLYI